MHGRDPCILVPEVALMGFLSCLCVFGLSMSSGFVTLVTATPLKEHAAFPRFDLGEVQYSIRFPKPGCLGQKRFQPAEPDGFTGVTVALTSCSRRANIFCTIS